MNVMIVGSGGREHALAWKASQSDILDNLYVASGNAGTSEVAENVPIEPTNIEELSKFALQNSIDLTIIGADDPLSLGIVDEFANKGLKVFGPSKEAAKIESSKSFAKNLMSRIEIPTADFGVFDEYESACNYLDKQKLPVFIKAIGPAQGKGAIRVDDYSTGISDLREMMVEGKFGEAGRSVVIESFMDGPEISLHALCDENTYTMFPSSQDHKPVFDNDEGLNTGGMGTVAPLPFIDKDRVNELGNSVVSPLLSELKKLSHPFKGLLYPGIKITSEGDKVIEYNARFGDPEAQVYMRLLKSDLLRLLIACIDNKLSENTPEWAKDTFAVSVALTSGGYPGNFQKGLPIYGLDDASKLKDVVIFHAGTRNDIGRPVTSGGRVLHCTAIGRSIEEARTKAYDAVELIEFEAMHYRKDIGSSAIELSGLTSI